MTRHHSCRVSPFGHPRIHARLTAPRGITQPPTSFIGSQCQGIHHAPLNTYNTKPKVIQNFEIAHQHTQKPAPQKGTEPLRARCSQPLSTNQTPHPTTKTWGDNQSYLRFPTTGRRDSGPVVSKPNSVPDDSITGKSSRSQIPFRVNVCCAPEPHPLQVRPIHRFAHGHSDPRYAGRPGSRGAP